MNTADDDTNYWKNEDCARAFWDQALGRPYYDLLNATLKYCQPQPGQTWIDLGCGSGQLTQLLWTQSQGQVAAIHSLDLAAVNEVAIKKIVARVQPPVPAGLIEFATHDLSLGLPQFADASVDGIVSGLAISYAESRDAVTGEYTDGAYNHVLADAFRVLKPGGRLVYSVNVPKPRFWKIFTGSFVSTLRAAHLRRVFFNSLRMLKYGRWLRREADRGRFHFFAIDDITARLKAVGFTDVQHTLSYAGQAYVILAQKADDKPASL